MTLLIVILTRRWLKMATKVTDMSIGTGIVCVAPVLNSTYQYVAVIISYTKRIAITLMNVCIGLGVGVFIEHTSGCA